MAAWQPSFDTFRQLFFIIFLAFGSAFDAQAAGTGGVDVGEDPPALSRATGVADAAATVTA